MSQIRQASPRAKARPRRREAGARRALGLHDRRLVVELIQLTLNHGLFVVEAARDRAESEALLTKWQPHMAVIDMDHGDGGGRQAARVAAARRRARVLR